MSWSSIGRVRGRVELAGRGFACCRRLTLTFAFQFAMSALTAAAATASTPVTVSATLASPLSSCTADAISSQPRVNFANTEVEPYLAVNPTNPQNVVATWQQDRWSNGGARGNLVATSSDGGATWTVTTATKSSACAGGTSANGGDLPRATDPWLSFAPNGDLYLMSLSFENAVFTHQGDTGSAASAMLVSRSTDGGLTWGDPATLIRDGCQRVNDKNAVTADPHDARFAYAVWTRYSFPSGNANQSCLGAVNSEISAVGTGGAGFEGPGWFSRSSDGGRTWEPAREIFSVGQGIDSNQHQIVVLPNDDRHAGALVDFFVLAPARNNEHKARGPSLALIRSPDRGATWSSAHVVDAIRPFTSRDPLTGGRIRAFDSIDVAVDSADGALYAVWKDGRFGAAAWSDIAFAMSIDGGATWSAPIRVNMTPATDEPANRQAFVPSAAVAADGSVFVSYYDLRFNGADGSTSEPLETDHFLARCAHPSPSEPDRCEGDWVETRITPASFDLRSAPDAGGLFLGDYMGLAPIGTGVAALFTQANGPSDPATVYFSRIP